MTQETRIEVVAALDKEHLRSFGNFTIEISKSAFIRHGAKLTTWEVHLIPVNGYMNRIQDILDAVRRVDHHICVFVTSLKGGCILLY